MSKASAQAAIATILSDADAAFTWEGALEQLNYGASLMNQALETLYTRVEYVPDDGGTP